MTKINKKPSITDNKIAPVECLKNSEISLKNNRNIAPFLPRNFFMDYAPLFNSFAYNNVLTEATNKIHKMSSDDQNPYTSSQSDNHHTATEILQFQFARHVGIMAAEAVDQKENLISALTKILLEAGYAQDKVDQTLTSFNTDVTIQEFTSYYHNTHVFKSMGFPNAKAFQAALQDIKQNRPKKNFEVELSPQYLLSLIKANDSLMQDKVRSNFYSNLKLFVDRVSALSKKPPSRPYPPGVSAQGIKTLIVIQKNSIINAKNALAAKAREREKIVTLKEYSGRSQFPTLKFVPKVLEKVSKSIQTLGRKRPIDLITNNTDIPCQLSCFKCSSSGKVPPSEINPTTDTSTNSRSMSPSPPPYVDPVLTPPKPLNFVDQALEKANVWRVIPLQTPFDVEQHDLTFHTLHDANKLTAVNRHSKTYFCRFCTKQEIQFSLICCRYLISCRVPCFFLFLIIQ